MEAGVKIKLPFQNASQTFGTYSDIWKGKLLISRMIDVGVFLLEQSAFGVELLSAAPRCSKHSAALAQFRPFKAALKRRAYSYITAHTSDVD